MYQYNLDLIHISSEENKVANYLTRKDIGEAEAQTEGEITATTSRVLKNKPWVQMMSSGVKKTGLIRWWLWSPV